jgi:hypothetical protein
MTMVLWILGVYLGIGLLWGAFTAFISVGLRLPFTLQDFADYVLCWPCDAWANCGPQR